jgi:hypothetical protein
MKRVVVVLLVLAASALVGWRLWPTSHASYITRISGVQIPSSSKHVAAYELDWCVVAKYRLPPNAIEDFRRAYSFDSYAKLYEASPMTIDHLAQSLEGENPDFRRNSGVVALRGRTKTNAWEFVLEPAVSSLWVVVQFPDMAGDLP